MRGIGIIAALLVASAAWAVSWNVVGYQMIGIPIGESTITESTMGNMTTTVDMTNGYSWKPGFVNFGFGSGVYFNSWVAAEVGFEMHTGYKNKAATIEGTSSLGGPFQWQEDEDNVTWKMMNLYFGPRFAYAFTPDFRILGRAGLTYSLNSKLEYDAEWQGQPITGVSATGTHVGPYFGGGFNLFPVGPHIAITGLYTYNMLLEGTYSYSGLPFPVDYEEKWEPAPYFTIAHGVEYYF